MLPWLLSRFCLIDRELDNALASGHEADAAVLYGQGLFAEEFSAPAFEGRNVGFVIEHEGIDVVGGCEDAGGDAVLFGHGLQKYANEIAYGALGRGAAVALGQGGEVSLL